MDFLASCSVEESKQYSGKLVVPSEDGGKPGKLMLNVVYDHGTVEDTKVIGGNVKCVTFIGDMIGFDKVTFEGIPEGVFHEVPLSEFSVNTTPKYPGVITLVRLPDGYADMRAVYDMCQAREDVRVIGGNLLGIDGVRIGRFDSGKSKLSPVYSEMYDSFLEVSLSEVGDVTELARKAKKVAKAASDTGKEKKAKSKGDGVKAAPKGSTAKISNSFSSLFGGSSEVDF
jgi:hypothetical protein